MCAVGSFLLAGCDDTVRVFQPEQKPLPQVLAFRAAEPDVITVSPVKGLPDPLSHELAFAMAAALGKISLPVVLSQKGDGHNLYRVNGRFEPQTENAGKGPPSPSAHPPILTWEVRDEAGQLVGRHSQILARDTDPTSPGVRAKLLADVEKEPARMMAKGIEGDAPIPAGNSLVQTAGGTGSRGVVITNIQGSPGRLGVIQLRQAIEYALKVANVRIDTEKKPDSLALTGVVKLGEVQGGIQHVTVTWSVLRSDGKELGQVSQENNVPSRILERVWGEITAAIAQNAASGIAAIVDEAESGKPGG